MTDTKATAFEPTHILVIDSGWVLAGVLEEPEGADYVRASSCVVIRNWGTTNGLGQLAIHGPTEETVLDRCTAPIIPKGRIIFMLPVESGPWKA